MSDSQAQRERRKKRIRAKISGSAAKPRVSVFKSTSHTYAQVIDDDASVTLASSSTLALKSKKNTKETMEMVAKDLAKKMKEKGVETIVFDRNGYKYHGKVAAIADTLRAEGIKF